MASRLTTTLRVIRRLQVRPLRWSMPRSRNSTTFLPFPDTKRDTFIMKPLKPVKTRRPQKRPATLDINDAPMYKFNTIATDIETVL